MKELPLNNQRVHLRWLGLLLPYFIISKTLEFSHIHLWNQDAFFQVLWPEDTVVFSCLIRSTKNKQWSNWGPWITPAGWFLLSMPRSTQVLTVFSPDHSCKGLPSVSRCGPSNSLLLFIPDSLTKPDHITPQIKTKLKSFKVFSLLSGYDPNS